MRNTTSSKFAVSRSALAAALTLSLAAGSALAAVDADAVQADAYVGAFVEQGSIRFAPEFKAAGYQLRITGPQAFHQDALFTAGESVSVSLKSLGQLADGLYRYEITPITGVAKRVDTSALAGLESSAEVTSNSGIFNVVDGKVVMPDAKLPEFAGASSTGTVIDRDEPSLAKDQVILDDLIVDGSICAGFDCVNGESFGFDTLRLKENNLRIKFDDTSNSGSFPSNDWQITANDSSNGGANKFSIDDVTGGRTPFTIEASAPSHSLYVDDGGRLGLGTSTPVVNLHVVSGNTPTMRLEQNGSSGFTAQTWDVAGNEANFFIRDVTNGSKLPFRIQPGAASNSIYVDAEGDVGFGTSSPDASSQVHIVSNGTNRGALRVTRNGNVGMVFEDTSATDVEWSFGTAANGDFNIALTGLGVVFQIDQSGNIKCRSGSMINGVACTGL